MGISVPLLVIAAVFIAVCVALVVIAIITIPLTCAAGPSHRKLG